MSDFLAKHLAVIALSALIVGAGAPAGGCQGGARSGSSDPLTVADCASAVSTWGGDALKVTLAVNKPPEGAGVFKLLFVRAGDAFTLDTAKPNALKATAGTAQLGDCKALCPAVEGKPQCVRIEVKTPNACLAKTAGVVCGVAN